MQEPGRARKKYIATSYKPYFSPLYIPKCLMWEKRRGQLFGRVPWKTGYIARIKEIHGMDCMQITWGRKHRLRNIVAKGRHRNLASSDTAFDGKIWHPKLGKCHLTKNLPKVGQGRKSCHITNQMYRFMNQVRHICWNALHACRTSWLKKNGMHTKTLKT